MLTRGIPRSRLMHMILLVSFGMCSITAKASGREGGREGGSEGGEGGGGRGGGGMDDASGTGQ